MVLELSRGLTMNNAVRNTSIHVVCVYKFFFHFWNGLLADLPFLLNWAFVKDFLCYIVKKAEKAIP